MGELDQAIVSFAMILLTCAGFVTGTIMGIDQGKKDATESTTIECVTKPKVCKIRYDYYQITETPSK